MIVLGVLFLLDAFRLDAASSRVSYFNYFGSLTNDQRPNSNDPLSRCRPCCLVIVIWSLVIPAANAGLRSFPVRRLVVRDRRKRVYDFRKMFHEVMQQAGHFQNAVYGTVLIDNRQPAKTATAH